MTTTERLQAEAIPLVEVIERMVERRTNGRIWNLRVDVKDSRILLSGRAGSYYAKQLAQHAAMDAASRDAVSREICNQIVVGGSS
jgi:hypothetical protein